MEEQDGVLFGSFTVTEVHDLYKLESSALEFGWLRKRTNNYLHNSLLKTPGKLTRRSYNLGGASPNLPRNPPTTPVSELNSRGTSPNPVPLSKLNANAPPFIPCSSPEPGDETETTGTEQGLSSVRAALEERLATPTNQSSPSQGSEVTKEDSTPPVQTVAVLTPSPSSATGGVVSDDKTRTDTSPTSHPTSPDNSTSHQSPSSQAHSPPPPPVTPPHSTSSTQGTVSTTPSSSSHKQPKSWASVVRKSGSGSHPVATPTSSVGQEEVKEEGGGEVGNGSETASVTSDSTEAKPSAHLKSLGDQLERLKVCHAPFSLQPRGLINQGNWCYMHAPLQALISLPEVCHLLRHLNPDPPLSVAPSNTPLTDALIQFIQQFSEYQSPPPPPASSPSSVKGKRKRSEVACGAPFRPDGVYDLLNKITTSLSNKGRQEDAEEFLGHVLGGLHEEMVAAQTAVGRGRGRERERGTREDGEVEEKGEEGEWEQVGPKNKSTVTRQVGFRESQVSEVFGGELRCVLQRQGVKESATVEPFFSLQLDIQSKEVWSLQDALVCLAMREAVQMNSGTQNEVDAHRRQSLARLPMVLVLHLKRFLFDKTGGSQKLLKQVSYKIDLDVGRDLLAPSIRSKITNTQRSYKLWAVVYHHGKSAVGGHYTCDVRHTGSGGWLRMDDSVVKPVPEEAVLRQSQTSNKVAYLLFYRRADCVTAS